MEQPLDMETKNRLVEQGAFVLKEFHDEYEKDKTGRYTEFYRGELGGLRRTVRAIYGESAAHDIIEAVRKKTGLPIPHSGQLAEDGKGYFGLDTETKF